MRNFSKIHHKKAFREKNLRYSRWFPDGAGIINYQ
jgi:hypothetical protein